jgi:hypothetical protein
MQMAKTSHDGGASSDKATAPIGGRYYMIRRAAVSGTFIESLRDDGVSAGTIHAIERDNAKRERGGAIDRDQQRA